MKFKNDKTKETTWENENDMLAKERLFSGKCEMSLRNEKKSCKQQQFQKRQVSYEMTVLD